MCDTVLGSEGPIAPSFLEGLACHARRLPPGVPLSFAACLDRCRRAARRHDASNSSLPDHPSLSLVSPTPGACSLRPALMAIFGAVPSGTTRMLAAAAGGTDRWVGQISG